MNTAADELDRLTKWDDLVARIYDDSRMRPGVREVALAMAWALERGPTARPGEKFWTVVRKALGYDAIGRWRLSELIAEDAPRYEEPGFYSLGKGPCEGPRLRPYRPRPHPRPGIDSCLYDHHPHLGPCRFTQVYGYGGTQEPSDHTEGGTICGADGTIRIREHDMATGWVTFRWFCRRHAERAREVRQQLAARGEHPEPIPNRGGTLPRYFAADWAEIYRRHCEKAGRGWTEPGYGVDADHWPTPDAVRPRTRRRLALIPAAEEEQ